MDFAENKINAENEPARSRPFEPAPDSNSFREMVLRLVGQKPETKSSPSNSANEFDRTRLNKSPTTAALITDQPVEPTPVYPQPPPPPPPPPPPTRSCRAPLSRKFAHPCSCGQSNIHYKLSSLFSNSSGLQPPPAASNPLKLYDPISRKCLPTSRSRDMLLKDCHSHVINTFPVKHSSPCFYDDLVCDSRRFRCVCKQPLHLYYESNQTAFGCVPQGPFGSPDGLVNCRPGQVYNVISRECQKVFDVNELPPNYTTGVSATQFSFVTIVLIWILLLILITTAKLRKLRTSSNLYRGSPTAERRLHQSGSSYRHQNPNTSAWLHPFIAAVNGHHHLNQHRTTVDRHSQAPTLDEVGNYNDTDFFLTAGDRRINDMLSDNNLTSSQQSLNNPPPKFEEIYPTSCQEEAGNARSPPPPPSPNEDLPTYDEAMKLQNTIPPDCKL